MGFFKRDNLKNKIKGRNKNEYLKKAAVQTAKRNSVSSIFSFDSKNYSVSSAEREVYKNLRNTVPVIDAAICKIVRLLGTFSIKVKDREYQKYIDDFVKNVSVNSCGMGLQSFIYSYIDCLLTYGEAVGEMVLATDRKSISHLYNACLDDVEIKTDKSPIDLLVCVDNEAVRYQSLILVSLLNPEPGTIYGTSILKGLPFVSSILMQIFDTIKTNWKRIGNVRFAVTYKPSDGSGFSEENAKLIADEWGKAMRSDSVCDFVSIGDVEVKAIGSDNVMPSCDVPIKHILEQIVAKLGIPPFLLGFSWSSTERMSEQQADILTSELEHYRNVLNPVISKIIKTQLLLAGSRSDFEIEWDNINLQDAVDLSTARLNNARALQIENSELANNKI